MAVPRGVTPSRNFNTLACLTAPITAEVHRDGPYRVSNPPRRLAAPWVMVDTGSAFRVDTADGISVAWVYYRDDQAVGTGPISLTRDEARRVAANIRKLPDLLQKP